MLEVQLASDSSEKKSGQLSIEERAQKEANTAVAELEKRCDRPLEEAQKDNAYVFFYDKAKRRMLSELLKKD